MQSKGMIRDVEDQMEVAEAMESAQFPYKADGPPDAEARPQIQPGTRGCLDVDTCRDMYFVMEGEFLGSGPAEE